MLTFYYVNPNKIPDILLKTAKIETGAQIFNYVVRDEA